MPPTLGMFGWIRCGFALMLWGRGDGLLGFHLSFLLLCVCRRAACQLGSSVARVEPVEDCVEVYITLDGERCGIQDSQIQQEIVMAQDTSLYEPPSNPPHHKL
jgi:hypothetical protein